MWIKELVLFVGLLCAIAVAAAGCVSLDEGYNTRIGLTNPDNPMREGLVDETFKPGTVGEKYMENFDKKYHEKDAFGSTVPPPPIVEESK